MLEKGRLAFSHIVSGGASAGLTLILFSLGLKFSWNPYSAILCYIVSSYLGFLMGFMLNRKFVWRSKGKVRREALSYFTSATVITLLNSLSIYAITTLTGISPLAALLICALVFTTVSFVVNKRIVFKSGVEK